MRTEDIVNKVFTRSFMGYDIEQVDRFLDDVIECLEAYEAEKREMLAAMEYLLGKLEKGQKLPLGEMRKAIEGDKSQRKRPLPPERALNAGAPEKRRECLEKAAEPMAAKTEAKAARSIGRGANEAQKPAPKVQRVVKGEAESAAPEEAPPKAAPAASKDGWFDELLTNLCERERQGFVPPASVCEESAAEKTEEKPRAEAFAPKANTILFENPAAAQRSSAHAPQANAPAPQASAPAPQVSAPAIQPQAKTQTASPAPQDAPQTAPAPVPPQANAALFTPDASAPADEAPRALPDEPKKAE